MNQRAGPSSAQRDAASPTEQPADEGSGLGKALSQPAADRRIDILRRIGAGDSISAAARGAGVSYKAAWQAIETLGNLAGQTLVDKLVGGAGGGGARLTPAGQRLLAMADRLDALRRAVLEGADDTAGALALRTSMRNLLRCRVEHVLPARELVSVRLATAAGDRLASSITAESAELLGLHPGLRVLALFKATAVRIEPAPAAPASADLTPCSEMRDDDNHLAGTVARPPAEAGGELSLALASGERITGFLASSRMLAAGEPASACVAAAAVVLALP